MGTSLQKKDIDFIRSLVNQGLEWEQIVPRLAAYALEEYDMEGNDCALCKQVFYAKLLNEARKYY